jgi:murein DD-endopeptidase MepM/ murein hydrolase activator NlpD
VHGLVLVIISVAVGYGIFSNGGFPGRDNAFAAPPSGLSMPASVSSAPAADESRVLRGTAQNKTTRNQIMLTAVQQQESAQFTALMAPASPTATPTVGAEAVTEDAIGRAAIDAPDTFLPVYQTYTVAEGDTLSAIASRFGISPDYIIANNAEVQQDANILHLGQTLLIPAGNGILHEVRLDDTLYDIATRYGVTLDAITGFAPNRIADPNTVLEQQLIYVPGGVIPVAAPAPVAEPLPAEEPPVADFPEESDDGGDFVEDDDDSSDGGGGGGIVGGGPSSSEGLIWPVYGPVSSYMGGGHPLGIDIDGFNLAGAGIAAATEGTVVFAGGNACCSYGLYVVIVSPGGIETLYAHLSSITVSRGEYVSQGQQIGVIGDTGYSTGRHLHFEVIDNGVRVNPMNYLP